MIVKEDLREFRKGLIFFMPYYRLPSCKSRCILKRATDFCSRNDVNLTLGYALQLVGREDADEIYDNSLKYFSYFRETLHSASQFGHNLYFVKRHYQEYLRQLYEDEAFDADNDLSAYYDGLMERLEELTCRGYYMENEEIICSGFRFKRWVYES